MTDDPQGKPKSGPHGEQPPAGKSSKYDEGQTHEFDPGADDAHDDNQETLEVPHPPTLEFDEADDNAATLEMAAPYPPEGEAEADDEEARETVEMADLDEADEDFGEGQGGDRTVQLSDSGVLASNDPEDSLGTIDLPGEVVSGDSGIDDQRATLEMAADSDSGIHSGEDEGLATLQMADAEANLGDSGIDDHLATLEMTDAPPAGSSGIDDEMSTVDLPLDNPLPVEDLADDSIGTLDISEAAAARVEDSLSTMPDASSASIHDEDAAGGQTVEIDDDQAEDSNVGKATLMMEGVDPQDPGDDAFEGMATLQVDEEDSSSADDSGSLGTIDMVAEKAAAKSAPSAKRGDSGTDPSAEAIRPGDSSQLAGSGSGSGGSSSVAGPLDSISESETMATLNMGYEGLESGEDFGDASPNDSISEAATMGTVQMPDDMAGGLAGRLGLRNIDDDDSVQATYVSDEWRDSEADQTLLSDDPELPAEVMQTMKQVWPGGIEPGSKPHMTIKSKEQFIPAAPETSLVIRVRAMQEQVGQANAEAEYELLKVLGEGGMGVVYHARQTSIDRDVAVKMLKAKTSGDKEQRQKFLAEAVVTGDLDHPNIVPIYDVGSNDSGALFYSMKKVQGTPWLDVIKEKTPKENLDILLRVADAVAFAHDRGVVHRDLKPENIMLGDYGEVLVMDWGLALPTGKFRKTKSVAHSRSMGGTPAYMAPEMATGPITKIGPQSDVYLLGAILFEVITGKPPHRGKNAMKCLMSAAKNEIRPTEESGELMDIAMKAMATDIGARYQTVQEFQEAIRDYMSHTESIDLSTRAAGDLQEARNTRSYEDYARALFGFQEAFELWKGNARARQGISETRLEYARTAADKGDLDLGAGLLERENPEHAELYTDIAKKQEEIVRRERNMRRMKKTLAAAAIFFVVGIAGAAVAINQQKQEAVRQAVIADQERQKAEDQKKIAEENANEAKRQTVIAQKNADEARKQTLIAQKNADEARKQTLIAEQKTVEAEKNLTEAKRQEMLALQNAEEAKKQQKLAETSAEEAKKQQALAEKNADEAKKQTLIAEANATEAKKQEALAKSNETKALDALAEAQRQKDRAEAQTVIAEKNFQESKRQEAIAQQKAIEAQQAELAQKYEAYIAQIGLAAAKINENAFETAEQILNGCEPQLRNWEWGRLKYLCSQGNETYNIGHKLDALAVSPNGRLFVAGGASGASEGFAELWQMSSREEDGSTDRPAVEKSRLASLSVDRQPPVYDAAFSADGQLVAIAGGVSGTSFIRVWNVSNPNAPQLMLSQFQDADEQRNREQQHVEPVVSVSFSRNGQHLLTSSLDGTARIWKLDGTHVKRFWGHNSAVWQASYSPDERKIATAGEDGVVLVWDVDLTKSGDPAPPPPFTGHDGPVYTVSFQPASASRSGSPAQPAVTQPVALQNSGSSSEPGEGSYVIASGGYDRRVLVWDPEDVQAIQWDNVASSFTSASARKAADGNGKRVIPKAVYRQFGIGQPGHAASVRSLVFAADGNQLVSVGDDNTVRVWDVKSEQLMTTFRQHGSVVTSVAVDPDLERKGMRWVLSGSHDETVRQWWVGTYEEFKLLTGLGLDGHDQNPVLAAAIAESGNRIVTGSQDRTARIWSRTANSGNSGRPTFEPEQVLREGHEYLATSAVFSKDGKYLFTAAGDNSVRAWNAKTGGELATFERTGRSATLALSPSGKWLLTGSDDAGGSPQSTASYSARLWDVEAAIARAAQASDEDTKGAIAPVRVFSGHYREVRAVAVSPDDRWAVTGDAQGVLRVWDLANPQAPPRMLRNGTTGSAHDSAVRHVTFVDNRLVLSGGDNSVALWDAVAGEAVTVESAGRKVPWRIRHEENVEFVTFDKQGKELRRETQKVAARGVSDLVAIAFDVKSGRLVTSTQNRSVRVWNVGQFDKLPVLTGQIDVVGGEKALRANIDRLIETRKTASGVSSAQTFKWRMNEDLTPALARVAAAQPNGGSTEIGVDFVKWRSSMDIKADSAIIDFSVPGSDDFARQDRSSSAYWLLMLEKAFATSRQELLRPSINALSISADSRYLLMANSDDGYVHFWDLLTNSELPGMQKIGSVWTATFGPEADSVLTIGGNEARLWQWQPQAPPHSGQGIVRKMTYRPHLEIIAAAYSRPDGRYVVTAGRDNTVRIWDAETGKDLLKLERGGGSQPAHANTIRSAVFADTDDAPQEGAAGIRKVLTASDDGTAKLWTCDLTNHQVIRVVTFGPESSEPVRQAVPSRDGKYVLTVAGQVAHVWLVPAEGIAEVQTPLATIDRAGKLGEATRQEVLAVAISPDNSRIATTYADSKSYVWDVAVGNGSLSIVPILQLSGHTAPVTCAAFSPDSARLLTGSKDFTVKLWDARLPDEVLASSSAAIDAPVEAPVPGAAAATAILSGKEILSLTGHSREITTVAFSPDGRSVLTASHDGKAILWYTVDWTKAEPVVPSKAATPVASVKLP